MMIRNDWKFTGLLIILLPFNIYAQASEQTQSQNSEPSEIKNEFALGIDFIPLFSNYPRAVFLANYTIKERLILEAGGGPVWGTERFFWEDITEHNSGYIYFGELRWNVTNNNSRVYAGIGYSCLKTDFTASFTMERNIGGLSFFQNFEEDFDSVVRTGYMTVGVRVMVESFLYLEPNAQLNFLVDKTELVPPVSGIVVRNEEIFEETVYPWPFTLSMKIGILIKKSEEPIPFFN